MSAELLNHSLDLKRLRDEGYSVEIREGHLLVHYVPYIYLGEVHCFWNIGQRFNAGQFQNGTTE